jgi:lipid II:glycine glycyltransferase (peptidoglycan interpeptide bridge formation enzyme)
MKDVNATVIVNLDRDDSELFRSLKKTVRTGIKRGIKRGLKSERSDEWEKAYKVYKKNREMNDLKAHKLEDLKKWADELFVCKKNGKIIAVNITWFTDIYDKNIPRALTNALDMDYSYERPNDLLYWKIFKYYKNKGYKKFDLGGWAIKPRRNLKQVNKFKESFGQVVYFYKDYPFFKAIGRKLVRNFNIFWNLNKKRKNKNLGD